MQITKDSEHPADLIQLRDGRVLLTYGERNAPRGVHAMLSADGRVWDKSKDIVLADDAPVTDCGYPVRSRPVPERSSPSITRWTIPKNAPATASSRVVLWNAPKK